MIDISTSTKVRTVILPGKVTTSREPLKDGGRNQYFFLTNPQRAGVAGGLGGAIWPKRKVLGAIPGSSKAPSLTMGYLALQTSPAR